MGCDIHIWAEVLRPEPHLSTGDGEEIVLTEVNGVWEDRSRFQPARFTWQKVGAVFPNRWYTTDREQGQWNTPLTDQPYDGRNYDLFAILADVRNGRGFAGVVTGDGLAPISDPRGVPDDASPEYRQEVDEWGVDGHSHSWLTLAELHVFNWDQTAHKRGLVSPAEYKHYKQSGAPQSWAGGVWGPPIVSNEEMERVIAGDASILDGEHFNAPCYTEIWWKESYRSLVGRFLTHTLPELGKLTEDAGTDVRIVFFFDN